MPTNGDCPNYVTKIDNPFRYEPNRRERREMEREKRRKLKRLKY